MKSSPTAPTIFRVLSTSHGNREEKYFSCGTLNRMSEVGVLGEREKGKERKDRFFLHP